MSYSIVERAIFLLSFTCSYEVSVRRSFLFLLMLWIGCVILLWHSLSLLYNYSVRSQGNTNMTSFIKFILLISLSVFVFVHCHHIT